MPRQRALGREALMTMRLHLLALVACAAFVGCGPPPRALAAEDCPVAIVKGQPSQITLVPSAEGVSFEPPQTCRGPYPDAPQYYIRVHGHGTRRIDYSHRDPNACDTHDADPVACPKVHFMAIGMSVLGAMKKALGEMNADTLGLGACADASGPLDQWNMSSSIHDFRYANEALRIIDAELRVWNIGDDWGLTIRGIECAELL
ncbi:hypothetical protein [Polyangium fumosum]|uniref:Uncharacterized protein n=1 Tax=Polyangium fumosum TaxID=889272 RepID=A0A4U1IGW9_9BACT|nr:hypothetical protein [Polyangium fumosum]TKC93002.1 hypothetical protein E8A74_50120 [Polyangium fumosum]